MTQKADEKYIQTYIQYNTSINECTSDRAKIISVTELK